MRILHVIVSLDPAMGGPPMVATRLGAAQGAAGQEVRLACYGSPAAEGRIQDYMQSLPHAQCLKVETLGECGRVERIRPTVARKGLRGMLAGTDFVHIHGVWDPICKAAACEARRVGVQYAICAHGMLDPWAMQQRAWKKRLALRLGYRRMLNEAAFLHCLNDDESRLIEPLGLRSVREVIPNGIFPEEVANLPPRGSFVGGRSALRGRRYVLFLSRLHYKKGLDYLAEAFAKVAPRVGDVDLVVAGPDGGERGPFEAKVGDLGLKSRVHVVGPLYGDEKLGAMVDATCFCLPSRQEGFSMAITEALAAGCPVVISENCHFPEVAQAGAGLVVKLDAGEVAGGLLQVLGDEKRREAMGAAGRKLVGEQFTWPKIAEMTIRAYERAISRAGSE